MAYKKYFTAKEIRITGNNLYLMCNDNNWFTAGSLEQYEALFKMLENNSPIHDIALVIWICSDGVALQSIEDSLETANRKAYFRELAERAEIEDVDIDDAWKVISNENNLLDLSEEQLTIVFNNYLLNTRE